MIELYERIKNTREDLDIKQYEFAKRLNILPTTYALYENGFRGIPVEIFDNIARELNVSVDYLFKKTKVKNYQNSKKMNYDTLLSNIKKYRLLNNYTQQDIADYLNIYRQCVSNYELGVRRVPVYVIHELSNLFNMSADVLLGKIEDNDIKEKITD